MRLIACMLVAAVAAGCAGPSAADMAAMRSKADAREYAMPPDEALTETERALESFALSRGGSGRYELRDDAARFFVFRYSPQWPAHGARIAVWVEPSTQGSIVAVVTKPTTRGTGTFTISAGVIHRWLSLEARR